MDLDLTEEQRLVQQTAREFADRVIGPKAAEIDDKERWPEEIVREMAGLGFMGIMVPPEWGGAGLDAISYVLVMEEISRACASCGVIVSVNNSLYCDAILRWGTDEQKKEFLAPAARGERIGSFALSEPGSGSDASAMVTTARREGDAYVIDGAKNFITNAARADHTLLFCKTDPAAGYKGIAAILVPLQSHPGVTVGPNERKLGLHGAWSNSIYFDGARVPVANRLGAAGDGFKIAMATLDGGRIGIAAQAIGIARAAFEASVRYAKERKTFGVALSEHQAIQFMIADMATEIDAARLLCWRAASLKDKHVKHTAESAVAKLVASEMATRVTHRAIQIHGGYGYLKDFPVERHYRDARVTEIYEGTSEMQRIVLARHVLSAG